MAERLVFVVVAGGIGSGARYLLVLAMERLVGNAFPWGVLAVNVIGSFLIAAITAFAAMRSEFSPVTKLALTTGFLGGFTTYSAFNQDTLTMIEKSRYGAVIAYVGATVVVCLVAGMLGTAVGRRV